MSRTCSAEPEQVLFCSAEPSVQQNQKKPKVEFDKHMEHVGMTATPRYSSTLPRRSLQDPHPIFKPSLPRQGT